MALFTSLSQGQIAQLVSAYGLPPPPKTQGVLEGTVNTYYRLTYPQRVLYLKVDEIGDLKRLKREVRMLKLLKRFQKITRLQTPNALPTLEGGFYLPFGKKFTLLFEAIEGQTATINGLTPAMLFQIGSALAHLHVSTSGVKLAPHRFHEPELKRVFRQIRARLHRKHPKVEELILKKFEMIRSGRPKKIPEGLIHADLFPENTMFEGKKLTGFLDFEAGGRGAFLFDVATTLHACCHDGKKFLLPRARSFLKGYESVRPLKEKKHLGFYLHESALRFLLTRLRDFELKDGPTKASPFKDYREFVRRFDEIDKLTIL